jgi:hypothetical protein
MTRRLGQAARRAAKKPGEFVAAIDQLAGDTRPLVVEAVTPALRAAQVLGVTASAENVAGRLVDGWKAEALAVAGDSSAAKLAANVETFCRKFEADRAAELAAFVFEGRAKPNKPARSTRQALDILARLPDADDDGHVTLTFPVEKGVGGEDLGVSPEDLKDAKKRAVKLRELVGTRPMVKRERVEEFVNDPEADGTLGGDDKDKMKGLDPSRPYVVEKGGVKYVYDGHHRLMAWQLLGAARVKVFYYKAD